MFVTTEKRRLNKQKNFEENGLEKNLLLKERKEYKHKNKFR